MKRVAVVVAVVVLVLGLAACGGSSKSTTPPVQPPVDLRGKSKVAIDAQNNLFAPPRILISPGTTVTWTNKDQVAHNIHKTADALDFGAPFGVDASNFGPGMSYSFTFKKTGPFPYLCTIHGLMIGNVQVDATASGSTATAP